ncbi:MAG TPA: YbjN domain-containing protein [Verrucomicrobiae bacterium]|nr:YbjN domain-containing protein [Verrucomicrobiae bacterium]
MKIRMAAAFLFFASVVQAQMAMLGGQVMTQVPPAKVQSIVQGMGLEITGNKTTDNSTIFYFQLASYKVSLDSHSAFMEVQLALSDKVTPALMNEWNRTHRFTRAYMDTDGGATLESDLDYTGGVTQNTIESFIKGFREAIPAFTKVVIDSANSATGTTPTTPPPSNDRPPGASVPGGGVYPPGPGVLSLLDGKMSVRYDPNKWKQKQTDDPSRFEFNHVKGDGYAVVIAERTGIPTDTIADIALGNIKKQDPYARMVQKQKRRVGGVDVWFQVVEATVNQIPVTYYGYYYGGQAGTIQLLLFTARNLVSDYDHDFMEFLNGLRVAY